MNGLSIHWAILAVISFDEFWIGVGIGIALFAAGWGGAQWWARGKAKPEDSNRRMALAAEVAHLGMWQWDILNDRLWMTATCCELFRFPADAVITGEAFLERVHPDDRALAREAIKLAMGKGAYHMVCRLRLPDLTSRWIAAGGVVDFDRARKPVRMLGVCMDISQRHNAETAAKELSGRLIHAQENERRRIARDLHDDLNQRLALLSVEMELLGQTPTGMNVEFKGRLEQAATQVRELSSEVHKLSYRLHPAKLDQLGLVAAARSFCRELTEQSGIAIQFVHDQVPRDLPAEMALCLYRVLQESLQNMVRHSRAPEANVALQCKDGKLSLMISDGGAGFDSEEARRKGGLGLISMEERVRLIRGAFRIQSQPGLGTQIQVEVQLPVNVEPFRMGI